MDACNNILFTHEQSLLFAGKWVQLEIIKNTDIAWVLSCLKSRQERHGKSGKGKDMGSEKVNKRANGKNDQITY